MNIADIIREQIGKLTPESISHFNGGEFAYFRPEEIKALLAEVERLTAENQTLHAHFEDECGECDVVGERDRYEAVLEDRRHLVMAVVDTCSTELGITIWPEDHNDMSELIDRCEEVIKAAEVRL